MLVMLVLWSSIVTGCVTTKGRSNTGAVKTPIALMEISQWSVEFAPRPIGPGGDSLSIVFSGSVRESYPEDVHGYLEQVKGRLQSKHKVDLSENFPEHGHIVIQLRGFEIDYTQEFEELVLHEYPAHGGTDKSPHRVSSQKRQRAKSQTAIVYFFDSSGRGIWQLTVFDAKKPSKLADEIAKCLKRP
jgi:hypothetical protein